MHQDISLRSVNLFAWICKNYLYYDYSCCISTVCSLGVQHAAKFAVMMKTSVLCLSVWRNDKSMQYLLLFQIQCPKSECLCYTKKMTVAAHQLTHLQYGGYCKWYSSKDWFLNLSRFCCTNEINYCLRLINE